MTVYRPRAGSSASSASTRLQELSEAPASVVGGLTGPAGPSPRTEASSASLVSFAPRLASPWRHALGSENWGITASTSGFATSCGSAKWTSNGSATSSESSSSSDISTVSLRERVTRSSRLLGSPFGGCGPKHAPASTGRPQCGQCGPSAGTVSSSHGESASGQCDGSDLVRARPARTCARGVSCHLGISGSEHARARQATRAERRHRSSRTRS
mmetsp:Transcript_50702/g.144869  ORF Transcript_50702/g.144869 Transcript_50702/m.144869 type:complete len:214 (-) Transcript_50702:228-869(-)